MEEGSNINWYRLLSAISYYKSVGYEFIDLNWTVNPNISLITKLVGRKDFYLNDKQLNSG